MEIGVVTQRGSDRATELSAEIVDDLGEEGVDVVVDAATAADADLPGMPVSRMADLPLVVSVGGDGTFLYAARHVGGTPVLGVNLGEVGFLNAVPPAEAVSRLRAEVARIRETGAPRFREVPRVEARGDGWAVPPGLNEVVVQGPQRGRGGGIDVEVRVDGSTYAAGHADGVLVATPTGSTAYNLSEGGPIVHPTVEGFVVTGMCAAEPMPPLVVDPESEIDVRVVGGERAVVSSDGSVKRWIDTPATVRVGIADGPARIAGPRSDFFAALEKIR